MRLLPNQQTFGFILVNGVFQRFTSFKARHVSGFNLDFLTRLWVTASTRCAVLNSKSTKADQ